MSRRSKVEIKGWSARHYDLMMDLFFLGTHRRFMRRILARMGVAPHDAILDLGSGTGRNACLMMKLLGSTGRVLGVDTGEEMLRQSRSRCRAYPQVAFLKARIEEPLDLDGEFDKACLFLVLHGFEDADKERIIANAHRALRSGGTLWILDYNRFDLDKLGPVLRWAFTRIECELAVEFLRLDLEALLSRTGFGHFVSHEFLRGCLRLLGARK